MGAYDSSGPIGPAYMQIPIDINELHIELRDGNSPLMESRTEYQISEWVKKLGRYCDDVTLYHFGTSWLRFDGALQIGWRFFCKHVAF